MQIKIKKISKAKLEKNGWKKLGDYDYNWYHKEINNLDVEIQKITDSMYYCEVPDYQDVFTDDLISIYHELKKLEEN